jgi:hypothetical protein
MFFCFAFGYFFFFFAFFLFIIFLRIDYRWHISYFSFDLQAHVPFLYLFSMYKSKIIFTANPIGFLSLFQFPHHHIFLFYVHFPCGIMKCKEEP